MKTYFLILATLFSSFVFIACNNDDDNQPVEPDNHPIVGKWELIKKEGDWNPITFGDNVVVWTFNENQVQIQINIDEEEHIIQSMLFPFHIPGTYNYSINENHINFELDYIQQEGYRVYPFEITNDTLIIGEVVNNPDDGGGIKLTFVRN